MKQFVLFIAVAVPSVFVVTGCQKADQGTSSSGTTSTNAPASTNQ